MQKLVDKNFEELNRSIDNLNTWQQENKNVLDKMSRTSSQIISDLDSASFRLKEASDYVERLTAPCGYTSTLVADLHTAMSDDYNFVEISNNLSVACRDINESVTDWGDVIRSLDKWLKTRPELQGQHREPCRQGWMNLISNVITMKRSGKLHAKE